VTKRHLSPALGADIGFAQFVDKELGQTYQPGAIQMAWRKIA
jgi:hypothetical protein